MHGHQICKHMQKEMVWEVPSNIVNIVVSGAGRVQGAWVAEVAWLSRLSRSS